MSAEFASAINDACSRTDTRHRRRGTDRPGPDGPAFLFRGAGLRPDLISVGKRSAAEYPSAPRCSERVSRPSPPVIMAPTGAIC